MSLKDVLFDFIDNVSLPTLFSRKTESLKQLRQPLLKGISNARRQYENGQLRAPHRWWKLNNDVVALTVKVKGNVFDINGVETNHIPAGRFVDFLGKFAVAVEAGEFDDELRNKGTGDAKVRIPRAKRGAEKAATTGAAAKAAPFEAPPPAKPAKPAAKTASAKPKRKPIDPAIAKARGAKAAATRAANKAKSA